MRERGRDRGRGEREGGEGGRGEGDREGRGEGDREGGGERGEGEGGRGEEGREERGREKREGGGRGGEGGRGEGGKEGGREEKCKWMKSEVRDRDYTSNFILDFKAGQHTNVNSFIFKENRAAQEGFKLTTYCL